MHGTYLQKARLTFIPQKTKLFSKLQDLGFKEEGPTSSIGDIREIEDAFPHTYGQPLLALTTFKKPFIEVLKIGVVFSGGQAPGGHNVVAGLFDAMKSLHRESRLFGFLGGPSGILEGKTKEITYDLLAEYRNQGGFDLIGSGRTKIETKEQFKAALKTIQSLDLDGIVVIGGDDSNTNAAYLAEYLKKEHSRASVVGVPKTIDGDLQNEHVAISFGFDTACKTYAEIIGNIARDALSAKKYYHFIRVMGRSASHIALECALTTRPNLVLISEEIAKKEMTLQEIVTTIADLVQKRAEKKKNYGVILIPEGIIESIPEVKELIKELNRLLGEKSSFAGEFAKLNIEERVEKLAALLMGPSKEVYTKLPYYLQQQLLLDRDPHGNVEVSKIDTEKLLLTLVKKELQTRSSFKGKFNAVAHFLGYEGRSAMPSNFDANYCCNLGILAFLLIKERKSGYMTALSSLSSPVKDWKAYGIPLTSLLDIEERKGQKKIVIKKTLVDLSGKPFLTLQKHRKGWEIEDAYLYTGPIQFFGNKEITDSYPVIMK